MDERIEILQITEAIPYRNFKEKIRITKEFDNKSKMIIEDKYVYVQSLEVAI